MNKYWDEAIKQAELTGSFTEEDKQRSGSYLSCSLGERATMLGLLDHLLSPEEIDTYDYSNDYYGDNYVRGFENKKIADRLAMDFHNWVLDNNVAKAKAVHEEIQQLDAKVDPALVEIVEEDDELNESTSD